MAQVESQGMPPTGLVVKKAAAPVSAPPATRFEMVKLPVTTLLETEELPRFPESHGSAVVGPATAADMETV